MRYNIIAVRRDDRYSPNSVERDRAILQSVIDRLGGDIVMIDEAKLTTEDDAEMYITMGRLPRTISLLKDKEDRGAHVINSSYGVEACTRSRLDRLMRDNNFPIPPLSGEFGYWIKRGDAAAQSKNDVMFCANEYALDSAKAVFAKRGIVDVVISAHVQGDIVKFYGVGKSFFRYYYPTDDHLFKFGDEMRNGNAHHYKFDVKALQQTVYKLARMVGVGVYGGDVVVDSQGNISIIDFNDWPSFSRCRDDAADVITRYIKNRNE